MKIVLAPDVTGSHRKYSYVLCHKKHVENTWMGMNKYIKADLSTVFMRSEQIQ